MSAPLKHDVIEAFWKDRSARPDNRWTDEQLLSWEEQELAPLVAGRETILDLGSGHGKLSRRLAGDAVALTAVDFMAPFGEAFTEPNHTFVLSRIEDYTAPAPFDLILLFGVVTHLDEQVEHELYRRLASWSAPEGRVLVKNQCGREREVVVNGWSEALGCEYSARYPTADGQAAALEAVFGTVEVVRYPAQFNPWPDSEHVMFVCSEPRR